MKIELDNIYNMDCVEGMQHMADNSVDCVVTSPPYDTMRLYQRKVEWSFEKFCDVARQLYRIMKDGAAMVWVTGDETINHSESGSSFRQALYFKEIGFNLQDTMIFQKKNPLPGFRPTLYAQAFEYMFVLTKGVLRTFNPIQEATTCRKTVYRKANKWSRENGKTTSGEMLMDTKPTKNHSNIFTYAVGGTKVNHPASFPIKLALDMVYTYSSEGVIVLDPFMGSGTTALACIELNRHFIGFELVEDYYDYAQRRIKQELSQPKLF